jgi:hypothetical protein
LWRISEKYFPRCQAVLGDEKEENPLENGLKFTGMFIRRRACAKIAVFFIC